MTFGSREERNDEDRGHREELPDQEDTPPKMSPLQRESEHLEAAVKCRQGDAFEEALELLVGAHRQAPGSSRVLIEIGKTFLVMAYRNKFKRETLFAAELAFHQAMEADANSFSARFYLSDIDYRQGRIEAALDSLRQAEALAPNEPEVPYRRGVVLEHLQRTEDALIEFKKAGKLSLARDSSFPFTAITAFAAALRLAPGEPELEQGYREARQRSTPALRPDFGKDSWPDIPGIL